MHKPRFLFSLIVMMAVLLSACGAPAPTPEMTQDTATPAAMMTDGTPTADIMMMAETSPADAMMMNETPTADAMMMNETPTADAMMPAATSETMMDAPAWFGATLTDVRNADMFTINDFKGKVVLVETMSVSCADCKNQQNEIQALREQLGIQADFVSVSLDVNPSENSDALKSYLDDAGFDWLYAVASKDVSHEIASLYGDQFLDSASAPVLIIDRHGVVHTLPFGLKKVDDLLQAVNMYLKGM